MQTNSSIQQGTASTLATLREGSLATDLNAQILEARLLCYSSAQLALDRIKQLMPSVRRLNDPVLVSKALLIEINGNLTLRRFDRIEPIVAEVGKLVKDIHLPKERAYVLNALSIFKMYAAHPNLSKSLEYNLQAYECAIATGDDYQLAVILHQRGNIHGACLEHDLAFECFIRAIERIEHYLAEHDVHDDPRLTAYYSSMSANFVNISTVYLNLNDSKAAMRSYHKAMRYAVEANASHQILGITASIANIYVRRGDFRRAISYYNRALSMAREKGLLPDVIDLLSLMADCYSRANQLDIAKEYITQALQHCDSDTDRRLRGKVLTFAASIERQRNELRAAEQLFLSAFDLLHDSFLQDDLLLFIYHGLTGVYSLTGEAGKFAQYWERYLQLQQKLGDAQRQRNVLRIEQRNEIRKMEQNYKQALSEFEKNKVKSDELNREVNHARLQLLRQQESLQKVRNYLKEQLNSADPPLRDLAADILGRLEIEDEPLGDLGTFEFEFERSTMELSRALLSLNPQITPTELRICTLSRIGMPLKKIGELMYLSLDTVKTHRKRIRRKLSLNSKENLTAFLIQIESR